MSRSAHRPAVGAIRVAEPSPSFWLTKAASTAFGEAASDWAIRTVAPELAVVGAFALFVVVLAIQLTRHRYIPAVYWSAVAMVGVFGTMAADVTHVVLGLPYAASAALYAGFLAAVFITWWRVEGTLSVHAITTTRREVFYWAAVIGTFALGTAVGDFTAVGLGLGYLPSIVLFAVLIAVPALGFRMLRWNGVACFWIAYVLTRPLGASVADWLGKPVAENGVGVGSGWVALGCAFIMVVLVVGMRPVAASRLTASGRRRSPDRPRPARPGGVA